MQLTTRHFGNAFENSGDRSCRDEAGNGRPSLIGKETRNQDIKSSPDPPVPELVIRFFNVHRRPVKRQLKALDSTSAYCKPTRSATRRDQYFFVSLVQK